MFVLVRKHIKTFSLITLLSFSLNLISNVANATDGPKQPEVKTFTPVSTSEMVDPFTGNFNYNIPLLDVGGYPINISYNANPTMEDVGSWVGLGWNINVGAIERNMRGIPDDFKGDPIYSVSKRKANRTIGVQPSIGLQLFGIDTKKLGVNASFSLGAFQNNYTGSGMIVGLSGGLDLKLGETNKGANTHGLGLGVDIQSKTSEGITVTPSISYINVYQGDRNKVRRGSFEFGLPWNTMEGFRELNFKASTSTQELSYKGWKTLGSHNSGSMISFIDPAPALTVTAPTLSFAFSFNTTIGFEAFGAHPNVSVRAYYSQQSLLSDFGTPVFSPNVEDFGFFNDNMLSRGFLSILPNPLKNVAEVIYPGYGYLYSQSANSGKVIHDFNREKDAGFTRHRPYLPIPNYTHDVFTVSGQGVGGMYRPFRNDIGIVHDPEAISTSANLDLPALEVGGGNAVHFGTNFSVSQSTNSTHKWSGDNDLNGIFKFKNFDNSTDFQPYYFKQAGEKTVDFSSSLFDNIGGFDPVYVSIDPNSSHAYNSFEKQRDRKSAGALAINTNTKGFRQPRNQDIQFLNANEASKYGLEKTIRIYKTNSFNLLENGSYADYYDSARANDTRLGHHISEITALRPDGSRYIYGYPLYNLEEKEVSFSIECDDQFPEIPKVPNTPNVPKFTQWGRETGLVTYDPASNDRSTDNEKGIAESYEEKRIPAYAHSFLLTAIVSDDYVDVTNDGPTDDDLGSYTKFNYTKAAGDHMWRIPFQYATANYFEAFNANSNDGQASYVFGRRDLSYLHSIVTKTHVAEFILEDRYDAQGVNGEDGGVGQNSASMKKLVQIDLYSKADKLKQFASGGTYKAVPIKSVHFEYDYSLCAVTPTSKANNDQIVLQGTGGKLTLKRIFFTYQNSNKARLSPYEFEYENNPNHAEKAQDRWGTYKAPSPYHLIEGERNNMELNNMDFPYTIQDKSIADDNASAWNLSKITLPSGGIIKITYESDDYAFVQDRSAMQMFTLSGIGGDAKAAVSEQPDASGKQNVNNFLFFKLSKAIPANTAEGDVKTEIRDRYLKQMAFNQERIYFKCFVDMPNGKFEYVPGYGNIEADGYGAVKANGDPNGDFKFGYVKLKNASPTNLNPIRLAAINMLKLNYVGLLKEDGEMVGCDNDLDDDVLKLLKKSVTMFGDMFSISTMTYGELAGKEIGKKINLSKSMIRLYNPYQNKLGGGSRVKRITISDEWNAITRNAGTSGNPTSIYGQEFDYSMPDGQGGIMSSGVALYEPIVGGEENPFRQPASYEETRYTVPNEEYFVELPMGENFFPAASVGYSKVTIRDISVTLDQNNKETIAYNKTGKVVHEFYTAKDFPVRTDDTELKISEQKPNPILQLFKTYVADDLTASQGYVVELNDMHGKERAVKVFQESAPGAVETPLSSVVYKYKTDPTTGALDNNALVMNRAAVTNRNGFIENRLVGVDYDFITDMRENESNTKVVTTQGNLETFFLAIFPAIVPIVLPELQVEKNKFRSAVTSKVINRYGLLDEVETHDLGKSDVVKNILYDAESGNVILTQAINEYNDPIYSFNYPAYFAYDGMGPAYKNSGTIVQTSNIEKVTGAAKLFSVADELLVYNVDSAKLEKPAFFKGWVKSISDDAVEIIDQEGYPMKETAGDGSYVLKVLRSGRRNLQGSSMGNVVTLKNPLIDSDNDGAYDKVEFDGVLDTKAIEYNSQWKIFCDCNETVPPPDRTVVR